MIRHEFPDEYSFWVAKKHIESLAPERVNGILFVEIDYPEFLQNVRKVGVSIKCGSLEMEFYGRPEDTRDLLHDCTMGIEEAIREYEPFPIAL